MVSLIGKSFENIKHGSYPHNAYLNDIPIEYKQRLPTKLPTDCLTNNSVERLNVNLVEWLLDNIIHEINPQNPDFDDLPFDGKKKCWSI